MIFNKNLIDKLNKNQKKLVTFLEKNSKKILNYSINKIAKENFVSSSFVTKTLKKIGFYGWKDYRAFVIASMIIPNVNVGYLKYLQKNLYPSIDSTIANINEIDIINVAEKIKNNKGIIYFVGEGFSYFIAQDQSRRYKKMKKISIALNSYDYEYESISKKDFVIFISSSGYTKSILNTINIINEKNIDYILITMNPLVKTSNAKTIAGRMFDADNINEREFPKMSRFIIMIILDWIYTKYRNMIKKQTK